MNDYEQTLERIADREYERRWRFTSIELPPRGRVVMTEGPNGTRQELKRHTAGALWFAPDGSMYVYYTPTRWRYTDADY